MTQRYVPRYTTQTGLYFVFDSQRHRPDETPAPMSATVAPMTCSVFEASPQTVMMHSAALEGASDLSVPIMRGGGEEGPCKPAQSWKRSGVADRECFAPGGLCVERTCRSQNRGIHMGGRRADDQRSAATAGPYRDGQCA